VPHDGTLRASLAAMDGSATNQGRSYETYTPSHLWPVLFFVASLLGCGGVVGTGPSQSPPPSITVSVAPSSASVLLGEEQTFSATVSNTTNTAVTWSVNGVPGGNASIGTVNAGGVYTAPSILTSPGNISITATSAAETSVSSSSAVTIASDVSVSMSPQSMLVELGAVRPFVATVNSAGNPNRSLNWALSATGCTGAACGTVDSSGMYTAPQILTDPPGISVVATSMADPSKSAAGSITVTSTFSLAVNGPASVFTGSSATYTAALTPAASSNPSRVISWSVAGPGCAGAACGVISAAGVYTAPALPPSPATVEITATPQADPSKATAVSVSILQSISVSVTPSAATVPLGGMQNFQATVIGEADNTVTWFVNGIVGGNVTVGSIQNSQTNPDNTTYTAPLAGPAGGPVTVMAQSNANPSISASVTITFSTTVNVSLTPASTTLALNEAHPFTAEVNNTANQTVAWTVNGIAGGNPSVGQICAAGLNPCQPVLTSSGVNVEYLAPAGVPSPNPVTVTATSQANAAEIASASVTILPHVVVSAQPANATVPETGQQRFTAGVTGTVNQQVIWVVSGDGCGNPVNCGSVDSTGLYSAPASVPSPNLIRISATSEEDTTQTGTATVTISSGPSIFSLAPTSAYEGSAGGFTLLVSGNNFLPSVPGPGSTVLVGGTARTTSCASINQCITSLGAADLQLEGNLPVQLQNPDGTLSNTEQFVVLSPGVGNDTIPLTPSNPVSDSNDIVVVELSTNGGSGAVGNVSLNIDAVGAYSAATSGCTLGGNTVVIQRPASGTGTADVCVFSVSALDPFFTFTISGPPTPDLAIINREPLGLGMLHLTLQVPASAAPGPRTLFVENPEDDKAAGTGVFEVQ
jgi:hypothetical protein